MRVLWLKISPKLLSLKLKLLYNKKNSMKMSSLLDSTLVSTSKKDDLFKVENNLQMKEKRK
jgi:hypothetical protein